MPEVRPSPGGPVGDFWGGLSAALVAFPSSIAFGVTAYAPLGPGYAAAGAAAGILGAVALGLVAPLLGGAPRLISSPCAPAAAVMAGLAAELAGGSYGPPPAPEALIALLGLVALASSALQVAYGAAGGGRLIKYIPYSVVSGYLSGAGLLLALGQLPKFLGLPRGVSWWQGLADPGLWRWQGLWVGGAAAAAMIVSPRLTRRVPAVILSLGAGLLAYGGLALLHPELWTLSNNPLVVGAVAGAGGGSPLPGLGERWAAIAGRGLSDLAALWKPALTLSVLLSIDTLKTCVAIDAMTESRHDSNRELLGQGLGNMACALAGGMPGAGTMGATLVNLSSGGSTRLSGAAEGLLVLAGWLALGGLVAWIPVAALAGILIVVGLRMVDRSSLRLLRHRSTVLDFLVIASVVGVSLAFNLVAAAGVGLVLTVFLFLRDQVRSRVLRRKSHGHQVSSKRRRLQEELKVLERKGREVLICELQGNLFFGTTDQLLSEIEPDLRQARYAVLDMRRVHSVDFTAAHLLEQIRSRLARKGGAMVFSSIPAVLPAGQALGTYFKQLGLVGPAERAEVFADLDEAVEWVEDRLLEEEGALQDVSQKPLELSEFELLKGLSKETLMDLGTLMGERSYQAGQKIFEHGTQAGDIYLVRRGLVKIHLPTEGGGALHLASFGRGDFFGDLSFLNPGSHSADAVAAAPTDLYHTPRDVFDAVAQEHHRLGSQFFTCLAETLGRRLRRTDIELRAWREG